MATYPQLGVVDENFPRDVPDKEFLIKSETMTPTEQTNRDFILQSHRRTPSQEIFRCICSTDCICAECERCCNSVIGAPLVSNRNKGMNRYGSLSSTPSPAFSDEDEPLMMQNNSSTTTINNSPLDVSIRCECHTKTKATTNSSARFKLIVACIIALLFMTGEVVGIKAHCVNIL